MMTPEQLEILKKTYYDPKTGFMSATKLFHRVKRYKIKLNEVNDFLANQQTYQIHKETHTTKKDFHQFVGLQFRWQYQADLIDYSKFGRNNGGYKWLLCVIDIYSRKAWVEPMKLKSDSTAAFTKLLERSGDPKLLQTDNGTEFLNRSFQKLCKDRDISHTTAQVGDHRKQSIVERFNRTIKGSVAKYFSAYHTTRWVDVIQDLVDNYNSSYHRTLGETPNQKAEGPTLIPDTSSPTKPTTPSRFKEFSIGDHVRGQVYKTTFSRGFEPRFSKQIYTIADIKGYTFGLRNQEGTVVQRRYKAYELQKVDPQSLNEAPPRETEQPAEPEKPIPTARQRKGEREVEELQKIAGPAPTHTKRGNRA